MAHKQDSLLFPMAVLVLLSLLIGFMPIRQDPDLWFHLASGKAIVSHGSIPQADPFSFTKQGQLWVPHSWLFDVGTYLSWQFLGPRLAEAIMAAVFMLTILISFTVLLGRRVAPLLAAVVCAALAIAAANTRGIRPQVFSLLICNLAILLLIKHQYKPRFALLVFLPMLFLLWAQLHAACVIGLIILTVWFCGRFFHALLGRSLRENLKELLILLGSGAMSTVAVLITPHRINHFIYLALTMDLGQLKRASEWQMPQLFTLDVPDIYIYLLVAGIVVLLARSSRKVGWAPIALCVSLALLALTAVRHIPLACIGSVPLISEAIGGNEKYAAGRGGGKSWRSVLFTAAVAIGMLLGMWRYPTDIQARYAAVEPVNGAKALSETGRPLRVFTTYNTGSYILFAAGENCKVFIDSRADVYGDRIINDSCLAANGLGWEELFKKWNIDAAVVERAAPLANILDRHNDWTVAAEDHNTVSFIRVGMQ